MKNRIALILLFAVFLTGSCSVENPYKYIEVNKEEGIDGVFEIKEKKAMDLTSADDTSAYLEAFKNFCISVKSYKDRLDFTGRSNVIPLRFIVLDKKGIDITSRINFPEREKREKDIENTYFGGKVSIRKYIEKGGFETVADIEELKKYISISERDEFDPDQKIWYRPKSASKSPNKIYCYFYTRKGEPGEMRLRIEFYADSHIFFRNVFFAANEEAFEYTPSGTRTNIAPDGYVTEWSDEVVKEKYHDMIKALAKADSAKMKFIGTQFSLVRVISDEQIKDIDRILEFYKLLGGEF